MLTLHSHKNKKQSATSKKKTFDSVEQKMSHIQASLTTNSNRKTVGSSTTGVKDKREVEKLKKELEEKECLASKLEEQCRGLRNRHVVDVITEVDEWEEELNKKKKQINLKKEQLKRIQDNGLKKNKKSEDNSEMFYYRNIDVKISLAEMEYSLEKDQIEMLNLSQKMAAVRVEGAKVRAVKEVAGQESLYRRLEQGQTSLLQADRLDRAQLAAVSVRHEGFGLEVREEGAGHYLQAGDRIIELNGENVVRILGSVWQTMMDSLTFPVRVVVMRVVQPQQESHQSPQYKFDVAHVNGLKDDIALIQSRLSEKLQEGRHVSLELSSVQQQRDKLVSDNTRLRHRIQYLEDQVSHLEGGMKQVLVVLEMKNLLISRTFHRISGQRFSCEDS